ncbi:MAG: hypothetical protein ACUVXF_05650 [Desulfobaccales bacterium]
MERLLLVVINLVLCLAVPVQAQDIRIKGWRPLPFVPEPPYIILEVEFPHALEKPREAITVDGRPAVFQAAGFGSSPACQTRDYSVYVGGPGKKEVSLTLTSRGRSLSASTQVDFHSRGGIIPLTRVPGEGIFSVEEWRVYVYFLTDLRVRVNDEDQAHHLTPLAGSAEHQLLSFAPKLKAGVNTLEITGRNHHGEEISTRITTHFLQDNTVTIGDAFWFPYGEVGSKSGPFYRLVVDGASLKSLRETFLRRMTLADNLWLGGVDLFSQELKAVTPGEATLKVLEKRWFTDPGYHLKASYPLKVAP